MSRQIKTGKKPAGFTTAGQTEEKDPFLERLVKLVPADVISVYMATFTIIKNQATGNKDALQWIIFGVIGLILPFYLKKLGNVSDIKQIVICIISYLIWVFSMGGPVDGLTCLGFPAQFLAAVITPLFTLAAPWLVYLNKPSSNPNIP